VSLGSNGQGGVKEHEKRPSLRRNELWSAERGDRCRLTTETAKGFEKTTITLKGEECLRRGDGGGGRSPRWEMRAVTPGR